MAEGARPQGEGGAMVQLNMTLSVTCDPWRSTNRAVGHPLGAKLESYNWGLGLVNKAEEGRPKVN